jgi:hypothetical protein
MEIFPLARRSELVVEELPDEVLVYDRKTDQAHCLNKMASLIWNNCNGEHSVDEIATSVGVELDTSVSRQAVILGLENLAAFDLLERSPAQTFLKAGMPRRQLIKTLGLTSAIALPLVVSIVAPTAAQAATVNPCATAPYPEGCPCTSDGDCASFNCNAGVCGPALKPTRD